MAARKKVEQQGSTHLRIGSGRLTSAAMLCVSSLALALSPLWAGTMQTDREMSVYALLVLGAVVSAVPFFRSGRIQARTWPGFWLAGVGILFVALSSVCTVSFGRTLVRDLNLLSSLIVFCAVAYSADDRRPVFWSAFALVAGAIVVSVLGGNEYAAHFRQGEPDWRVFSTMFNPGYLAGFLVLTIPVTLALIAQAQERAAVAGLGFALALQIAVLGLTGARAGVLALAVGLAVFGALAALVRLFSPAIWVRLGLSLAISIALATALGRPTVRRVEPSAVAAHSEGHSFAFRKLTWIGAMRTANARPVVGFGPGTFDVALPGYAVAGFTRMAHSNYLQGAAEYGWPGDIALFGAWLALIVSSARALALRKVKADLAPFVCAALAACACTAVRGVFDSDWWSLPIALAASALAGVLARATLREDRQLSLRAGIYGSAVTAAAALLTLALALVVIYSSFYAEGARAMETSEDWPQALEDWRTAGRIAPWDVNVRLRAAQLEDRPQDIERLHRLEPTNPRVFRSLAELYLRDGRDNEALAAYQQARKLDPLSSRLTLEEALLLEKLGHRKQADGLWSRLLYLEKAPYGQVRAMPEMVDPAYAWAHARRGDQLQDSGDMSAATSQWKQADELLSRYFASLKELRPVLEAAGLTDPELESQARALQNGVREKLQRARQARALSPARHSARATTPVHSSV